MEPALPEVGIEQLRRELQEKLAEVKELYQSGTTMKDKAETLYHRLIAQVQDTKRVDIELVSTKKKVNFHKREKDGLINDISNERAMKKKLEECCRELQKQNRSMRDEFNTGTAAENDKREELKQKLQNTLEEVTQKAQESDTEKSKLAEENEALKNKILELRDSAIARDVEYKTVLQQKSIELQMCKAQVQHKTTLSGFEFSTQLMLYKEKFSDFQSTLDQSNEAFRTLENELQKLTDMLSKEEAKTTDLQAQIDELDVETMGLLMANENIKEETAALRTEQTQLKAECGALLNKNK